MEITNIYSIPRGSGAIPIYLGLLDEDERKAFKPDLVFSHHRWMPELIPNLRHCEFRGVSFDAFPRILKSGIDVEPTTATIYVSACFDKAWEYGGFPKLILVLDREQLDYTFRFVSKDASDIDTQFVQNLFPTKTVLEDGSLRFSRLAEDDPGLGTGYEYEYARWIPGLATETLQAIFIFTSTDERLPVFRDSLGQ